MVTLYHNPINYIVTHFAAQSTEAKTLSTVIIFFVCDNEQRVTGVHIQNLVMISPLHCIYLNNRF